MAENDTFVTRPSHLSSYRPDIDGLRAIAVISVVLFHAFPGILPGGFVGVDVFFVISGFLISDIIFRQQDAGTFSWSEFYSKRIRRIFPSLLLVLAFCFSLGWFLLFKNEFIQLGRHILSGAGFVSNFVLWQEADYFDAAAEVKPLLHLWSLAVEEQFYIFFPLIFALIRRRSWPRTQVVLLLMLASFGLNIAFHQTYPTASFYAPWTRFWEILAGSMLAQLYSHEKVAGIRRNKFWLNLLVAAGVICLILGFALPSKGMPFPGWFALLPVMGSFLLIGAGKDSQFNRHVLAQPGLKWIGRISYPLYLWHWPLLVFARIAKSEVPSVPYRIAILLLSVLLSWLTCLWVENRFRFGGGNHRKIQILSFGMVAAALVGFVTTRSVGFPWRTVNELNHQTAFQDLNSPIENTEPGCGIADPELAARFYRCHRDKRGTPSIALIGDSKSHSLSYGLIRESDPDSRVLFMGGTGDFGPPLPVLTDHPAYERFQPQINIALDALIQNHSIKVVIITVATRTLYDLKSKASIDELPTSPNQEIVIQGLGAAIKKLVDNGKKVIMTVDNPTLPDPTDCIKRVSPLPLLNWVFQASERNCSISEERHRLLTAQYQDALKTMEKRFSGNFRIFDTLPLLCDSVTHLCSSIQDGHPNYSYTDHISQHAAARIGQKLIPFAKEFARLGPKAVH